MDNPRLFEQLDRAIDALLAADSLQLRGDGAAPDTEVAALIPLAEDLRALPREDFKTRLKADLEGSTKMATPATHASTSATQRPRRESLPRPEGYRTITPYLTVKNAEQLLEFVKKTFNPTVLEEVKGPAGRLHAEVRIGDSPLMMGSSPAGPWFPTSLHVRVDKVDEVYERAVAAGAKSVHGPQEMEYGERAATVIDASGNNWYLATPNAKTHWLPEMSDVTIYLHPRSSDALFEFAKRAFGAEEIERHAGGGIVHHAKIRVGDSVLEMGDAHGDHDPMPTMFYLYVSDVDAAYDRAVGAGATSVDAPAAMPYGDYVGSVADPFGNRWYMASPTRAHRPERATQQPSAPVASSSAEPSKVSYIRPGFRTLTPYLLVDGAAREIEFLKNGLGATEKFRVPAGERIMHAQVQIGDAVVELADANAQFPARAMMNILYVPDPDAAYARALAGGGTSMYPVSTKPWGDRDGVVVSPGGVIWCLSNRGKGDHISADTPSLVPGFIVKDAGGYIEFMKRAFGAEEMFSHKAPDGTVIHSRVRIGNSVLGGGELVSGGPHERKEVPFLMHVYVPDVDAVYANALAAGATTVRDLEDAPYGDRTASVADPYGNLWSLATHIRDVRF
jgi:PhnB protein